jgi:hypothetical protein
MLHNLSFFFLSLQNAVYFVMLPCLVAVLFTFKILGVLKFKRKLWCQMVNVVCDGCTSDIFVWCCCLLRVKSLVRIYLVWKLAGNVCHTNFITVIDLLASGFECYWKVVILDMRNTFVETRGHCQVSVFRLSYRRMRAIFVKQFSHSQTAVSAFFCCCGQWLKFLGII